MDLHRIFKPVIFISRVFCLAPFAAVEDSGSTRYKLSTFWLLYSILGVCAAFIVQINLFWIPLSISNEALYNAFTQVVTAVPCVASVVIQVLCLNNGKNVIRILDDVSVLDSEHSGARISYYRLYVVFIVYLICCIIFLVAFNTIWFASLDTNSVYILKLVYYSTVYFVCDVVLLLLYTQFIHFVLLLKYRFSVLNDTLINFTDSSFYKSSLNHVIRTPSMDRSVNSSISAISSSITLLKSAMGKVCRHHDSLCDISESVNRTYSLQILLSITVTCIDVLYVAYSISNELSNPTLNLYSSKVLFSIFSLARSFAGTAKVVLLVVVCNRASHEVCFLHLWCPYVCFLNTWHYWNLCKNYRYPKNIGTLLFNFIKLLSLKHIAFITQFFLL